MIGRQKVLCGMLLDVAAHIRDGTYGLDDELDIDALSFDMDFFTEQMQEYVDGSE